MKKVSIAAVTARRNISQPKLTIGLDLAIATVGTAWWMKPGQIQLEQQCPHERESAAGSLRRDAAQSDRTGNRRRILPGSVAC